MERTNLENKCKRQLEALGYSFFKNDIYSTGKNGKCKNHDWIRDLLLSGGNDELSLDDIAKFIIHRTRNFNK